MRHLLILTTLAMVVISTPPLLACPCRMTPSPCEAVNEADAIFLGTAVRTVERDGYEHAVLRVDQAYAGVAETEIVFPGELTVGKQYVVYARRWIDRLSLVFCEGALAAADSANHLEFLRGYAAGATKTEVSGTVMGRESQHPMKDVRVMLSSVLGKYETETNGSGRYTLSGVPPGEYELDATLPGFDTFGRTVRLRAGACASNYVELVVDRRVLGTVRTASGDPVAGVRVQLVQYSKAGELNAAFSDETDADGNYAIRRVEPGEYELGVNIFGTPLPSSPHVPTYWPGRKVFVPEGAAQLRYDWVEPERIRVVTVRGRVLRADGTPSPERPELILRGAWTKVIPDGDGWFQFDYCEGQQFHIEGLFVKTEEKEGVAGDGKELVLVLI